MANIVADADGVTIQAIDQTTYIDVRLKTGEIVTISIRQFIDGKPIVYVHPNVGQAVSILATTTVNNVPLPLIVGEHGQIPEKFAMVNEVIAIA